MYSRKNNSLDLRRTATKLDQKLSHFGAFTVPFCPLSVAVLVAAPAAFASLPASSSPPPLRPRRCQTSSYAETGGPGCQTAARTPAGFPQNWRNKGPKTEIQTSECEEFVFVSQLLRLLLHSWVLDPVRVPLLGQLAVARSDLLLARAPLQVQNLAKNTRKPIKIKKV